MKLQPVGGTECNVLCCKCGKWVSTSEALADMDGKAFESYYHPDCAPSIYEQLKAAGVPMDNHESDLYAKVTPESERILALYKHRPMVTKFKSNTDGAIWFDIPLSFDPFWAKRK